MEWPFHANGHVPAVVGTIGPFVGITYGFRPSCGNRPVWGNRPSYESYTYTINPVHQTTQMNSLVVLNKCHIKQVLIVFTIIIGGIIILMYRIVFVNFR